MINRKIALLIDVDNVKISGKAFEELYDNLKEKGEVVYSKFYGYNDRKHIYLSDTITKYGYETAPFMRFKKRYSQLDNRMIVDAVTLNYAKPEINTFCIVAGEGDLIPLLVELKSSGKHLIDINSEYQDINGHMFDEHIVLKNIHQEAEVYVSKTSKPETVKEAPKKPAPVKPQPVKKQEPKKVEVEASVVNDIAKTYEDSAETEMDYKLSEILREITTRYNQLDFTNSSDIPKKLKLIRDIEDLIESENAKGKGVYSPIAEIRQIFSDLQDVVDDMKNAL